MTRGVVVGGWVDCQTCDFHSGDQSSHSVWNRESSLVPKLSRRNASVGLKEEEPGATSVWDAEGKFSALATETNWEGWVRRPAKPKGNLNFWILQEGRMKNVGMLAGVRTGCLSTDFRHPTLHARPFQRSNSTLTQPDDLKLVSLLVSHGPRQTLPLPSLTRHLLCLVACSLLSSLSPIHSFSLFILRTFPVVGLDVILYTPTPELLRLRADEAAVEDSRVVLEPIDQVVDVVVADPRVVLQRELP